MQKYILCTGGLGYIGSHNVLEFVRAGYTPVILDNLSNSHRAMLAILEELSGVSLPFFEGNVGDRELLQRIFSQYTFAGVLHFAGLKSVGESCQNPFLYYQNNITESFVLFEEMERANVRTLLFSSSATVYAPKINGIANEDDPLGASQPYGNSKLILEYCLKDLSKYKNWRVIALRYFNPVGAHESGLIGERPVGTPNNLVPYIYEVATKKRPFLGVFGDDFATPDGTGVRDYIPIADLASAHLAAFNYLCGQPATFFDAINIGIGKGKSVLDMVHILRDVTGQDIPYEILPRRSGDLGMVCADVSKAKEILGWEASADFNQSLAYGWKFAQTYLK